MAIRKILGVETEFGIMVRGADSNPISASSMLINAYLDQLARDHSPASRRPRASVGWDFDDEQPGNDARGFNQGVAPEVETHLVNAVLTNGARYYVDHAHPELSTPECADPRSVVVYDRAAEVILQRSMEAVRSQLPPDTEIVVYKNNSDGKGNSYGCHENYLMDRAVPFGRIVSAVTPHLITRQVFTGSGKLGCEAAGTSSAEVEFQLTQRADFFEEEVGLETTLKRPIVNTRDEPHADPSRYRRLHVICGDANCSEVATFLKVGTTALVLCMVEDDRIPAGLVPAAPVRAMRAVSYDVGLREPIELADGRRMTALEIQGEYLAAARAYTDEEGLEGIGGETVGREVLDLWERVLEDLAADPDRLATRLDWVAKRRLLEAYRERHGLGWGDPRLAALALQYHDLRPERSLAARVGLERISDDDEVARAVFDPPEDTRAYFRGECLKRWPDRIVTANWDSMVFDVGGDPLRRVPMLEPLRGTRAHVGSLIAESETAAQLLERLGQ